jgi:hypothetical protein
MRDFREDCKPEIDSEAPPSAAVESPIRAYQSKLHEYAHDLWSDHSTPDEFRAAVLDLAAVFASRRRVLFQAGRKCLSSWRTLKASSAICAGPGAWRRRSAIASTFWRSKTTPRCRS